MHKPNKGLRLSSIVRLYRDKLFSNQHPFTRQPSTSSRNRQRYNNNTNRNPNKYHRNNVVNPCRQYEAQKNAVRSANTTSPLICFNCLHPDFHESHCKLPKDQDRIKRKLTIWKLVQNISIPNIVTVQIADQGLSHDLLQRKLRL